MPRPRIKICGLTRLEDALLACELGADALGFNLWPGSKRHVDAEAVRAIVERLPPLVTTVGVFVNQPPTEVLSLAAQSGVQAVQLHGDESWEDVNGYPIPAIKAFRVAGPESLADLHRYRVKAVLLDAPSAGYGGSGQTFDWALAAEVARRARVILAGGLRPDNVAAAVRAVRPYAVDVASGVESAPGVKDPEQVRRFVENASQEIAP
ncbi:MAG TPA: phosphoribosylanthranilate isomerase [Anaeromyxobacteraceae bacterium]|nr:phosphoribosylanthranilate isomerase [Anaeromyxobacteraceae bacterium]